MGMGGHTPDVPGRVSLLTGGFYSCGQDVMLSREYGFVGDHIGRWARA